MIIIKNIKSCIKKLKTGVMLLFVLEALIAFGIPKSAEAALNNSYVIPDATFVDNASMTEQQIQRFLVSKNSFLKNYIESRSDLMGYPERYEAQGKTAAHIIWWVSNEYKINPQVILATLQKEQSSIADMPTQQWLGQTDCAMGYEKGMGCTWMYVSRSNWRGFAAQVDHGAWQLRYNYDGAVANDSSAVGEYLIGNTIYPSGIPVQIGNAATASLYRYTPYIQTSFYTIFTNWFPTWTKAPILKYSSGNGFWDTNRSNFSAVGDFNGDGKKDIAAMYDYGNGKIGIWVFESNGLKMNPKLTYLGKAGYWNVLSTKGFYAGDFNDDGKEDIAAMYDYGNGKMGIWVFESNGYSMTPRQIYIGKKGEWDFSKNKFSIASDVNGDGKKDIVAMYDYGNGKMGIWGFESAGYAMNPRLLYIGKDGDWDITSTLFLLDGDFNGDLKGDLAAMYYYGSEKIGIWTFQSNGTKLTPVLSFKSVVGFWNPLKNEFSTTGDFNGDGKTDIGAMYDYGENKIAIWNFKSRNGLFYYEKMTESNNDCWNVLSTEWLLGGDFNGDGKGELASMYDYGYARIGIWSFGY